uniref:Cytochrome P450 n=1 Tax=Leersia perrieri TaxID=77586 RepID=A0A0D9VUF7_9ORYZ
MASLLLLLLLAAAAAWVWGRQEWRARAVERGFAAQGVRGPRRGGWLRGCNEEPFNLNSYYFGNRQKPYISFCIKSYKVVKEKGGPFLYWLGPQPRICISDYDLVKQILSNKYGHFVKNDAHPVILSMIGKGLLLVEGTDWVRHHRVLTPAFAMDKLKMMTRTMASCAECLIKEWEDQTSTRKSIEIEVEFSKQFQDLTADIICRTAFGSSSKEGKEIFHAQRQLLAIVITTILNVQLPGFKYLPTKRNRCKWTLEKKLKNTLMQIIQSRIASKGNGYGDDLLGVMLDACFSTEQGEKRDELVLTMDEIIDECKTFFFAGHETTSHLLTWTMFLLSVYPEWQDRLRVEVLRECGKEKPNADMLSKLKEMTMVLLETLRLYPPVISMFRKPITDMQLGRLHLPRGTAVVIPIPMLHRDKEVWGDDANEFNPLRFENGVIKAAKIPHALLGFSIGPRSCIGQNFAMLEAKSVMAMILQKFSFTLSPSYVHAPADLITLQPKFGLPMLLRALDA